jgi:hypothetical protein
VESSMSSVSNQNYIDESDLAYGESTSGGLETSLLSSQTETQLINDQDIYLAQTDLSSWIPISVEYILQDGFYGVAYQLPSGNIIISFEGTVYGQLSNYSINSLIDDNEIDSNETPQAFLDAQSFAASVIATALSLGPFGLNLSSSQISVTGHSLGGAEAEYVSANLELSGVAFGAPGLPTYTGGTSASSFTTYVDYGDAKATRRFASADPLNPNRVTDLRIQFHALHPPALCAQRKELPAAGFLFRRNRTTRPLQ